MAKNWFGTQTWMDFLDFGYLSHFKQPFLKKKDQKYLISNVSKLTFENFLTIMI